MSSSPTSSSSSSAAPDPQPLAVFQPLADVECDVQFVLGTGRISVRQLLQLECQQVIRLLEVAGSDLEVRVHAVPVASGEVVVVDDKTCLRITHIVAPPGQEAA